MEYPKEKGKQTNSIQIQPPSTREANIIVIWVRTTNPFERTEFFQNLNANNRKYHVKNMNFNWVPMAAGITECGQKMKTTKDKLKQNLSFLAL